MKNLTKLKVRAWLLGCVAWTRIPAVRRARARAVHAEWEASLPVALDADDVFQNGMEWPQRPLPTEEADRRLELHDAEMARGWEFQRELHRNY